MAKRNRPKKYKDPTDKRGTNPKSLANLQPVKDGDPPRNPSGKNGFHPYSAQMRSMSTEPMDEVCRIVMNRQMAALFTRWIKPKDLKEMGLKQMPDFYPPGVTWAGANALRRHYKAVLAGDTRDAVEIREAVEGRATQRIEIGDGSDPLKELIQSMHARYQQVSEEDDPTKDDEKDKG